MKTVEQNKIYEPEFLVQLSTKCGTVEISLLSQDNKTNSNSGYTMLLAGNVYQLNVIIVYS